MDKPITDIAMNSETGIVSFKFMGGKTDGIKNISTDGATVEPIYSISGIRMNHDFNSLPKGIYIIGGKKMVKE